MNKYETDLYHVLLFDRFGGKVDVMLASGYTQAQRIGHDILEEEPCNINSYIIMRVLYNSLMPNTKQEYKPK